MRHAILLILFFYVCISVWAQSDSAGQRIIQKKCGIDRITLSPAKYGRDYPTLFQQISVIDARPDTSRIGILRSARITQREVALNGPVGRELTKYLNAAYSRVGGRYSLLVVLKDFWVASVDTLFTYYHPERQARFRADVYLEGKEGYHPLTRIDTTGYEYSDASISEFAIEQVRDLLDVLMAQVAAGDLDRERRTVNYRQIDSFNRKRFDYPMDTAKNFAIGVYATAADFWNNAPSISNYTLAMDKSGHSELDIADETGKMIYTHTVWGFCDSSRQRYVMMDGNLYPLYSVGHQFYVLGSKEYHKRQYQPGIGLFAVDIKGTTTRPLQIFRIDPESGDVIQ